MHVLAREIVEAVRWVVQHGDRRALARELDLDERVLLAAAVPIPVGSRTRAVLVEWWARRVGLRLDGMGWATVRDLELGLVHGERLAELAELEARARARELRAMALAEADDDEDPPTSGRGRSGAGETIAAARGRHG